MAGIRPEDSRWVADKLFQGFDPAPMPCCDFPGSKTESEEHQCCERQKASHLNSERESAGTEALFRYRKQFGQEEENASLIQRYLRIGIAPSRKYGMPGIAEIPDSLWIPELNGDGRSVIESAGVGSEVSPRGNAALSGWIRSLSADDGSPTGPRIRFLRQSSCAGFIVRCSRPLGKFIQRSGL